MSSIIITKGLPISILFTLTQFDNNIDLHSGDWEVEVSLRYQTERGAEPWPLTYTPAGDGFTVDITGEQTSILNIDSPYVLLIKISRTDETIFMRNSLQVRVIDDL